MLRRWHVSSLTGIFPQGADPWGAHTILLSCFVHGIAKVVSSLTHLQLTLSSSEDHTPESMTELLSLLATACPALQQLYVEGDISMSLLAVFGASCPDISSIKMVTEALSAPSEKLQQLFPRLTHYCCQSAEGDESKDLSDVGEDVDQVTDKFADAGVSCSALLPCAPLTHMDFGMLPLTPEMWHALPQGLQLLRCCVSKTGSTPPAGLRALKSLQHLELYCTHTMEVELGQVVLVLRVAPNARTLTLSSCEKNQTGPRGDEAADIQTCIRVLCLRDSIPKLSFLHDRMLAGLGVTSNSLQERSFAGVRLMTRHRDNGGLVEEDNISWFLEKLPPFAAFKGLELIFANNAVHREPSITQRIAAAFPNLTFLRIHSYPITNDDLVHLEGCAALQHLYLSSVEVNARGVFMLCTRLTSLEVLQLSGFRSCGFDWQCKNVQQMLQAWGTHVKVIVESHC